jgi:triacylglycerol lipase
MVQHGPSGSRLHIVMVPGFAGFDALGQMGYYAGVTRQFQGWQKEQRAAGVVLHYFDNFPTAAVVTRAGRLRRYLAKRIARGTFQRGDALALVGHSTGGLDIRWLLWELTEPRQADVVVDGVSVPAAEILQLVRRVVFLSVPQWGTNIADWVRTYQAGRTAVIAGLRAGVETAQLPVLDRVENWALRAANYFTGLQLGDALQDALRESAPYTGDGDPSRTAGAYEAASELDLWLRQMGSDFHAIDDLASQAPPGDYRSPAHFPARLRAKEVARWGERIKTQSYATLGRRPFRFNQGGAPPRWDLSKLWTYPEVTKDDVLAAGTDLVYRMGYRACAAGPFHRPVPDGAPLPRHLKSQTQQIRLWRKSARMEIWDNDGIVNTLSMFWPDLRETVLVLGDHMDIVGHYKLVEADQPGTGRKYLAYDLMESASGFGDETFAEVWSSVFRFCSSGL